MKAPRKWGKTTSSCLSGEIPKTLLKEQIEEAYKMARWYQDVFGPENFYLEIQEHHGIFEDGNPSVILPIGFGDFQNYASHFALRNYASYCLVTKSKFIIELRDFLILHKIDKVMYKKPFYASQSN